MISNFVPKSSYLKAKILDNQTIIMGLTIYDIVAIFYLTGFHKLFRLAQLFKTNPTVTRSLLERPL